VSSKYIADLPENADVRGKVSAFRGPAAGEKVLARSLSGFEMKFSGGIEEEVRDRALSSKASDFGQIGKRIPTLEA
jgi:hypothetical protein